MSEKSSFIINTIIRVYSLGRRITCTISKKRKVEIPRLELRCESIAGKRADRGFGEYYRVGADGAEDAVESTRL